MDYLKQQLAPFTDKAWDELSSHSEQILRSLPTARTFVDVTEPQGWKYSAIPNGKLNVVDTKKNAPVQYGIREVQPLIEVRAPFSLNIWELDNLSRGAATVDLSPLETAEKNGRKI